MATSAWCFPKTTGRSTRPQRLAGDAFDARGQLRLEWGWGPWGDLALDRICDWRFKLQVEGGRLLRWLGAAELSDGTLRFLPFDYARLPFVAVIRIMIGAADGIHLRRFQIVGRGKTQIINRQLGLGFLYKIQLSGDSGFCAHGN